MGTAPKPVEVVTATRTDAGPWSRRAIDHCLEAWIRLGRRYARRLDSSDRVRDASGDVLTLAARREVPLDSVVRLLLRPLPGGQRDPVALAFNRLDQADRYVLRRLDELGPVSGSRTDHLASALERLAEALDSVSGVVPTTLETAQAAARWGPRPG
jgi:hypothetical protein